jgi:hypothetical protein
MWGRGHVGFPSRHPAGCTSGARELPTSHGKEERSNLDCLLLYAGGRSHAPCTVFRVFSGRATIDGESLYKETPRGAWRCWSLCRTLWVFDMSMTTQRMRQVPTVSVSHFHCINPKARLYWFHA